MVGTTLGTNWHIDPKPLVTKATELLMFLRQREVLSILAVAEGRGMLATAVSLMMPLELSKRNDPPNVGVFPIEEPMPSSPSWRVFPLFLPPHQVSVKSRTISHLTSFRVKHTDLLVKLSVQVCNMIIINETDKI
jgi:hypothetical protein